MIAKTIDERGRLTLGKRFAGQTFFVDDSDADRIVITRAKVIPAREAWLYENETALGLLRQGLAEAKSGRFSRNPPGLDSDSQLAGDLVLPAKGQ
jgi:hypothetical protein